MNLAEYISFVYKDNEPKSEHQYVTFHPEEYYINNYNELNIELADFYRLRALPCSIHPIRPSKVYSFLNYHYDKYKGDPIDFLYMVENLPLTFNIVQFDQLFRNLWLENEQLKRLLSEWVDERKAEIKFIKQRDNEYDDRIKSDLSPELTLAFFIKALGKEGKPGKDGQPILADDLIIKFVHSTFAGFPHAHFDKIQTNAVWPAHVRRPFHKFFKEHNAGNHSAIDYCQRLKDCFSDFDGYDSADTLSSGFAD